MVQVSIDRLNNVLPRTLRGKAQDVFFVSTFHHEQDKRNTQWLIVMRDDQVYGYGTNYRGILGTGDSTPITITPKKIELLSGRRIIDIAAGSDHVVALCSDGRVFAWGGNSAGQLGNGTTAGSLIPIQVKLNAKIKAIAVGNKITVALGSDSKLYLWGTNAEGQLGCNKIDSDPHPFPVSLNIKFSSSSRIEGIFATESTIFIRSETNRYYGWGSNRRSEIGCNSSSETKISVPTLVEFDYQKATIIKFCPAGTIFAALCRDGSLYVWGDFRRRLATPTLVKDLVGKVTDLVACGDQIAAITDIGQAYIYRPDETHSLPLKLSAQVIFDRFLNQPKVRMRLEPAKTLTPSRPTNLGSPLSSLSTGLRRQSDTASLLRPLTPSPGVINSSSLSSMAAQQQLFKPKPKLDPKPMVLNNPSKPNLSVSSPNLQVHCSDHHQSTIKSMSYRMDAPSRGTCLIFNQVHFFMEEPREGSEKDAKAVELAFKQLDFNVKTHHDLTVAQLFNALETESRQRIRHQNEDCFVCCIMTHGDKGNTLAAKDASYSLGNVIDIFNSNRCPSLAGKPKIFIIQACRGDEDDHGALAIDSTGASYTKLIPCYSDILICWSTTMGFVSYRNPSQGSWFIQELCKSLADKAVPRPNQFTYDFVTIMTLVAKTVGYERESRVANDPVPKKQMPCFYSTLTHRLYFFPKRSSSLMFKSNRDEAIYI